MWIVVIAVIIILVFIIFRKSKSVNTQDAATDTVYTKAKLQTMTYNELDELYLRVGHVIMPTMEEPASRKIPSGTEAFGCKTWGEARDLLDLLAEVMNEKKMKQKNEEMLDVISGAEWKTLSELRLRDVAQRAYNNAVDGENEAMMFMGLIYYKDLDKPKKSFYWMERAAKAGNAKAAYFLGTYYLSGYGVEADKVSGVGNILRAAKGGCKEAIDFCRDELHMSHEKMAENGIPFDK